ncbi:MAG: hypothetical protein JO031_16350 [Ktedonobacteraceae bacterium]|nr:hypothetical protein [Ktedonobacteraceae bacterium]
MKPEEAECVDAGSDRHHPTWTDLNPGRGEKGGFRKITATLPQWAYELLIQESARRKIAGEPNQLLSALFREAISDYLRKLRHQTL